MAYSYAMKFNENSGIKTPSILHVKRLGYDYLPLKDAVFNAIAKTLDADAKDLIVSTKP